MAEWWDGGSVQLPLEAVEREFKAVPGSTYWRVNLGNSIVYGLMKPYKDSTPLVVDELKRVFNLTATGSKKVVIGSTPYLLYRARTYEIGGKTFIHVEPSLNDIALDRPWNYFQQALVPEQDVFTVCRPLIREFYAFRDLLGLTPNNNSIFKLRSTWRIKDGRYRGDFHPHPITMQDTNINPLRKKNTSLPLAVLSQWFDDITVSDVVSSMTGFGKEGDKIHERIAYYRSECEKVIMRIDRSLIWISGVICERLMTHYLRASTPDNGIPWAIDEFSGM